MTGPRDGRLGDRPAAAPSATDPLATAPPRLSRRALFAGAAAVLGGAIAAGVAGPRRPARRPKWIGHC